MPAAVLLPRETIEPELWTPAMLGGIATVEDAQDWLDEVPTIRTDKARRDFARIGAGHTPRGGAGSFASYDALIAALTAGQSYQWNFLKVAASVSGGAGYWSALWTGTGTPGAGAAPAGTPGAAYSDTAGGVTFPAPGGGMAKFLTTFGAAANQNCVLAIFDRLVGVGAIAAGSTGDKTVSSAALPSGRYDTNTTALDNEAWAEVTTAPTATAPVMRLNSYTTGDGTSGQDAVATLTWPSATTVVRTALKFPFLAGKPGIKACSTINVATAGSSSPLFNFVIKRPLAFLPLVANVWNERDLVLQLLALPRVFDTATLDFQYLSAAAITPTVWGAVRTVYG